MWKPKPHTKFWQGLYTAKPREASFFNQKPKPNATGSYQPDVRTGVAPPIPVKKHLQVDNYSVCKDKLLAFAQMAF